MPSSQTTCVTLTDAGQAKVCLLQGANHNLAETGKATSIYATLRMVTLSQGVTFLVYSNTWGVEMTPVR